MIPKLLIWGAGGHALVLADIIHLCQDYEIAGFIDSVNTQRHNEAFCGSVVLGGEEQLEPLHRAGVRYIIVGIGNNSVRMKLSAVVCAKGFQLVTVIHPRSIISNDAIIGSGTVVMAGAVLNPGVCIGQNVIINTAATIDHECLIEDYVHIGPGVHLGGRVHVGLGAWIGIGSVVKDKIHIGAGAVIGAGSVVLKDIPERVVAYGVPATIIKRVKNG